MITPGQLAIRASREGGVYRLTPIGEVDLATAPQLKAAFDAVFRDEDAEMIVLDLTELSFMDSTGIHVLLGMQADCEGTDRFRVINGTRAVERILDLTGVRAHLPIISRDTDPLAPLP